MAIQLPEGKFFHMANKPFKNKRILITGITGFVGKHLSEYLESEGAVVFGVSKKKETTNIAKVDITNYSKLRHIISSKKIEQIYHLAGEAIVEKGHESPYGTYKNNILGTVNVLELAREENLERVIVASTSHVYGRNRVPYYEGYLPRPTRPYETSKACVDLIASSYSQTYNLPVLITRFVNIYGPGDLNFSRIIPRTIKSIVKKNTVSLWSGKAMRDFLFIEDAIAGYAKLGTVDMRKIGANKIFNFGYGKPLSVSDLVTKIIKVSKKDVIRKKVSSTRTLEIQHQFVSWNKAKKILNWSPSVSLLDGLSKTYAWYEKYLTEYD